MVALEAFSELLQVLYSAPLQQEQWQRSLALVSDHTRSQNSYFLSADTSRGLAALAQGGKLNDPAVLSEYNKIFSRNDPFLSPLVRKARTGCIHRRRITAGGWHFENRDLPGVFVHGTK
jgi:hypothetical protein